MLPCSEFRSTGWFAPIRRILSADSSDDQPGFRELTETAIREKAEWEADYRIVHPDGSVRDIHVLGHPVLSTSGHLIEFVGTVIDVTERKRAEEERRRSEMELRQMLDLAPQQVKNYSASGPGGERLYANRIALDYYGVSFEEWQTTGHAFRSSLFVHPDDQERAARAFDANAGSTHAWFSHATNATGKTHPRNATSPSCVARWVLAIAMSCREGCTLSGCAMIGPPSARFCHGHL